MRKHNCGACMNTFMHTKFYEYAVNMKNEVNVNVK